MKATIELEIPDMGLRSKWAMTIALRIAWLSSALIVVGASAGAPPQEADNKSQTIVVVPGPLTGDAKLEDEYWAKSREVDQLLAAGSAAEAIELLEKVWGLVTQVESLENQQPWVMQDRGRAFLQLKRTREANEAFDARVELELKQGDCSNPNDDPLDATTCGEAYFELATTRLMLGQNRLASDSSHRSIAFYRQCLDEGRFPATDRARVSCRLRIGQGAVMAGVAETRLKNPPKALALLKAGIEELEAVEGSPDGDPQSQAEALRWLGIAQNYMP